MGCVIMAAGNSVRFGSNKLMTRIGELSLIEHTFNAVPRDDIDLICVVTQYRDIEDLARSHGFSCVRNDRPEDGISLTVRLGTEFLSGDCDAIIYLVSDQPLLRKISISGLISFYRSHPEKIIASSCNGKHGNPCIFPSRFFPELCSLTGDTGGSKVIRTHEDDLLLFEIPEEELQDIDTMDNLKSLTT